MSRILGIFDIVSSDLCLILSNLRAVQSASQSVEKIFQIFKRKGGGHRLFEQCKCRISKEVDPLLSTCQSLASLSSIYFLSFLNVNVTIDFFVFVLVSVFVLVVVKYCHFNVMSLTANEGTWVMEHSKYS